MCADNVSRNKTLIPPLQSLFSHLLPYYFLFSTSRSKIMTSHKNMFPFFKILVFEILVFLYTQRGLIKKNSWKQNALWGILTWQPCGSDVIVTRDAKHHVLSKHKNSHFSASRSFLVFFQNIPLVPIIIRAFFSERYSVYVLVPRYS